LSNHVKQLARLLLLCARFISSFRQKKITLQLSGRNQLELTMKKFLKRVMNRKVSTQRIDDMPSFIAVSALDRRVNQMLAMHASQPLPGSVRLQTLSNPTQMPAIS
jgi:hypothetical protein